MAILVGSIPGDVPIPESSCRENEGGLTKDVDVAKDAS